LDPNSAAARRRKKKLAEMKKKDDSIESNFDANFKDDFGFESDFQSTAFSGFQDGSHPLDGKRIDFFPLRFFTFLIT